MLETQTHLKFKISKNPFAKRRQKRKFRDKEKKRKEKKRKEKKRKEKKEKQKEKQKKKQKMKKERKKNFELCFYDPSFFSFFFSHRESLSSVGHQVDFCVRVFGKDFFKGFPDASHRSEEGIPGTFFRKL